MFTLQYVIQLCITRRILKRFFFKTLRRNHASHIYDVTTVVMTRNHEMHGEQEAKQQPAYVTYKIHHKWQIRFPHPLDRWILPENMILNIGP